MSSRGFCFTINNDTYDDLDQVLSMDFKYLCFAFEEGQAGTPHIQGYVYLDSKVRPTAVRKLMRRAHVETARGSMDQNIDYCSKTKDNFYEFGERVAPGRAAREKIEYIMSNPYENFHLYNQYRKSYFELQRNEKRLLPKVRHLTFCHTSQRFTYAKQLSSKLRVMMYPSEYLDEDVIFAPMNTSIFSWLMNWTNGYPSSDRRGYEVITIDPTVVVIYCDSQKEINILTKEYIDFLCPIDDVIEDVLKSDMEEKDQDQ